MKWAVEIQKTSLSQRNLTDLLEGLGFSLIEGIEYPALTSSAIDECRTVTEAFEIASKVRTAFRDVAKIDLDFQLGAVIDYSAIPPSRQHFLEADSMELNSIIMGTPTLSVTLPCGLSPTELAKSKEEDQERKYQAILERQRALLEPAYLNPRAAKVIDLLCKEALSGQDIYKIYEYAEGDTSNRAAFQSQFGILKDQFNRFKDAVHNPSVSGEWARHASPQKLNSSNPMTKTEAEKFVRDIAERWLQSIRKKRP